MLNDVRHALHRAPARLPAEGRRPAGVAMVLDDAGQVLFIRRADKQGDPWSGHVGLPGGHVQSGESFEEAARRETLEEVGLDLDRAELLGSLDDRETPGHLPTKLVRPFVYRVPRFDTFTLQRDEVASTHLFPLHRLLRGHGRSTFPYPYAGREWTLPCVDLDGVRLWGLTLRIVDDLLDRIDGDGIGLDRRAAG
ncbi:MAG: CoA pyrophosphatase [Alphaproteobacteria bacterium]|nr:CoA pyrophosphatase [Alphaproteobacteria bacterium]